jgi:hypothetical protein
VCCGCFVPKIRFARFVMFFSRVGAIGLGELVGFVLLDRIYLRVVIIIFESDDSTILFFI